MKNRGVWVAFLVMCFLVVGLTGMFASYSTAIPLEAAMMKAAALDPTAQAAALADGRREAEAVGKRTRLMVGVVTVLAAGLGSGILLIAAKGASKEAA